MKHSSRAYLLRLLVRALPGMIALWLAAPNPMAAQRWQETIGGGASGGEVGHGVIEAANGDIVTAGTSHSGTGNPQVYVVRTDANGTLLWHFTYDIEASGWCGANDIKEYPGGDLAVVGWSLYPAGIRAFAMRLDPSGAVLWISHLQTSMNSMANSVVIATQGNGGTTNAGDLLLGGWWNDPAAPSNYDGLLARLDGGGTPIWIQTYDLLSAAGSRYDALYGIDEAQITNAGDVVATGESSDIFASWTTSLWVLRVDGNTGATGASPQGSGLFTTPKNVMSSGRAIIELRNSPYKGDLVITGITNNTINSSDILALEITADPCDPANPRALYRLGEFTGSGDEGLDLCEITDPAVGNVGNIMITGETKAAPGGVHVFLQEFQAGTMATVGAFYFYGNGGGDVGYSLAEVRNAPSTPGYIVSGFTGSPALMPPGHTQDLYLIKVNGTLDNPCFYKRIEPPVDTTYLIQSCSPPVETSTLTTLLSLQPATTPAWTENLICFVSPKVALPSPAGGGAVLVSSLDAFPRPLGRGTPFTLGYSLSSPGNVSMTVADAAGRIVYRHDGERDAGRNVELVSTDGWSAGTYLVRVGAGGSAQTTRVVVINR